MNEISVVARTIVYATFAFAPLAILLLQPVGAPGAQSSPREPASRQRRLRGRVRMGAVLSTPALVAGGAAALGGAGAPESLWIVALSCSYQFAWFSGYLLLGARRLAAVVVAVLPPLIVAATFAPNTVVESSPGVLASPLAPAVMAHIDPVIGIGHHLLNDAVLVRNYSYYQAEAHPPAPGRLLVLHLAFACLALLVTGAAWIARRSPRASRVDPRRRSPA